MFETIFSNVRSSRPLIHSITNYVTANDCANLLLACGASPIMADDPAEAAEVTKNCNGLVLNIGTLHEHTIPAMLSAGKQANALHHPVIFDPVGAGVSPFRTQSAHQLLQEIHCSVIRGNLSEIKTLALGCSSSNGVDAADTDRITSENLSELIAFAKQFALSMQTIVIITGTVDIVTDGSTVYCIENGYAMMSSVTGTGCQLSVLTAAFTAANPTCLLDAAAAAVCAMGLVGELAFQRMTALDGNASYRTYMIDAMYHLTPAQLAAGARYVKK